MRIKTLTEKVKHCLWRQTVCFSFMVITINPLVDGQEDGNQQKSFPDVVYNQDQRTPAPVVSSMDHDDILDQKILDYYKLGKLYLLQGQLGSSYKAFLMGENLEDIGAIPHGNLLGPQNTMIASSLSHDSGGIGQDSLSEYLKSLVSLYLKRVEILSKNPAYLDEARREVEKIFIIDPRNKRAQELAREIKEKQESLHTSAESVSIAQREKKQEPVSQTIYQDEMQSKTIPFLLKEDGQKTSYIQKAPLIDEKEHALSSAEQQIHTSILEGPEVGHEELILIKHYEQGKTYLKDKDYLKAIKEFKKVLALDPDHLYSDYARKFINAARDKIKEQEEYDLKLIQEEKIIEEATITSEPVEETIPLQPKGQDEKMFMKSPQKSSPIDHLRMKREEVLRAQIKNVLASIRKFIREGRYTAAQENLYALLAIDPENKEARALQVRLDILLSEKREREQEKIESDIRQLNDEEETRRVYFAKKKRRQEIRQDVKEKYKMAQENLRALLAIDPENEEARALQIHLDEILSEKKERDRIESNILRIQAEEELRKKYFARLKRRAQAREEIENKYKEWININQETIHREVKNKIAEKLSDARYALSVNDYFRTNKELEILSIISPYNTEAQEIRKTLRDNIQQLTTLLKSNNGSQNETVKEDVVKKEQVQVKVSQAIQRSEDASGKEEIVKKTAPEQVKADGKIVFKKISNFRPPTVLNPHIYTFPQKASSIKTEPEEIIKHTVVNIEAQTSRVGDTIKPDPSKDVQKENTADTEIKQEETQLNKYPLEKKHIDFTLREVKQNETPPSQIIMKTKHTITNVNEGLTKDYVFGLDTDMSSSSSNEKQKLMKYLVRGKRHFRQGNYPLALVSFNKVKSLDKEQLFLDEVEGLISATKRRLESQPR